MPLAVGDRTLANFIVKGHHNHPPDHNFIAESELRRIILQRVEEESTEAQVIFDEECQR